MRLTTTMLLFLTLTACSSADQRADEANTVQMKDQMREQMEQTPERVVPEPPQVQEPAEELAVEMVDLDIGRPVTTESGMQIRMVSAGPTYAIEFSKEGRKQLVEYSSKPLYIEGVAFGNLFTISKFGEGVQATLRSDAPEKPLPTEAAADIARNEKSSQLGCSGPDEKMFLDQNGTAVLQVLDAQGTETCRIVVGLYTGRVVDL